MSSRALKILQASIGEGNSKLIRLKQSNKLQKWYHKPKRKRTVVRKLFKLEDENVPPVGRSRNCLLSIV
jgi:hypothetical protein